MLDLIAKPNSEYYKTLSLQEEHRSKSATDTEQFVFGNDTVIDC
mgnify:CR=1 FL=1